MRGWGSTKRHVQPMTGEKTELPSHGSDSGADSQESLATDHSLLRRFRAGNQDAATELYVRYSERIAALARAQTGQLLASRVDPEDVVQSVFRSFFRRAVESGYEVPAGEELWQLLLVLALNKIRSLAKFHGAQKRDVARTNSLEGTALRDPADPAREDIAYEAMRMVVDELLATLPPPQDRIVELRIEGYQVPEIAKKVCRSKRTVDRALQNLRQQLAKQIDSGD